MMRSAVPWNLLITLVLLAEWQLCQCGSLQIQPSYNGFSKSRATPVRFYDNILEDDPLRTAEPPDGFNLATASRSRAIVAKVNRRLVLETTSSEVQALIAFKAGITSDPLDVLRSWRANDSDACTWQGVKCSPNSNHVAAVNLGDLQLHGTVSALLGQLSFLEQLDISANNFSGFMPESLGDCSNLSYLNISFNQLTGDIPAQLGQLDNLLVLDLSYNNLTGEIPATLGNCSLLEYLDLNTNSIGGDIPAQLGRLSSLQTLNLQSCFISGSVPATLGNCTSLISVGLAYNSHLGGELPPQLGELINLQQLSLFGCNFGGNFPQWILNLTAMKNLYLGFNQFEGEIPGAIGFQLPNLTLLNLRSNKFSGEIPRSIVNNTALLYVLLSANQLTGNLPPDIGLLRSLQVFHVYNNFLTGSIPPSLSNCSQMTDFMVGENPFDPQVLPSWIVPSFVNLTYSFFAQMNLYGRIPEDVGQLSKLQELVVYENNLTGTVPASLGNCSSLNILEIHSNQLSGELPLELGFAPIFYLQIGANLFPAGPIPAFIFNLTMIELGIQYNQFNGRLDSYDFGKFGQSLQILETFNNDFEGPIPQSFANCSNLQYLAIEVCGLSGEIPSWLGNLTDLGELYLGGNQFSGTIPADLLRSSQLAFLDLTGNNLEGAIPGDIGRTVSLQYLSFSTNNLSGDIPSSLGNCSQLVTLLMSQNKLTGSIPAGSAFALMASSLGHLDLSQNLLSGPWPSQFSDLINLQYLNVSNNNISGSIPSGLGKCTALQTLDLSFNQFTGSFPQDLGSLQHLIMFNASYNNFEGPIPDSGAFKSNLTATSFLGNPGLCGGILGPHRQCTVAAPPFPIGKFHCKGFKCASVWISVVVVAAFVTVVAAVVVYYYAAMHNTKSDKFEETFIMDRHIKFSKTDVLTTMAAGEKNIIGKGANSTVYKATLQGGETVAMKTWNKLPGRSTRDLEIGNEKRWEMEISSEALTLAKLRHRNIIKVFGLCSLLDVKVIVLEYMPNGSLYSTLHENGPCTLTWAERFKIILGAMEGMMYLHHEFPEPIIHRDLKSSNILLDADLEPKVCDFGISKTVTCDNGEASASTIRGTFGYLPPEYGTGARVSTKGDVYSFGVVLFELLTAKKATELYGENENLVSTVTHNFRNSENLAFELLDPALKHEGNSDATSRQQMMLIMRVGLFCTRTLPQNRPSMKVVRDMMVQIKEVGQETTTEKTLDDLLACDVASTSSENPDSNPDSSSSSY